jgi:poly(hydroxyalkanoate) depolymerase family esterase
MLGPAQAGRLADRDFEPQSYPGSDHRDFYVYLPDGYDDQTPAPMVMVLHGCHQTRDTIFAEFGWDEIADTHGIIVVAPDISTNDPMRFEQCWGYWESDEIHQGGGEVEDLMRIGQQVEQEWSVNPHRRHIAGLSSGGFMANAAAVAHNEYWASAGVHSGGGYKEGMTTFSAFCSSPRQASGDFHAPQQISADMLAEMDSDYKLPMMLIHSENDCTVGYGVENDGAQWGGLTSNRKAWLTINGGDLFATGDCSRDQIECRHQQFGSTARSTLEVVSLVGLIQGTDGNKGHYWSGGKAEGQWTKTTGPSAARLLWDFFRRHPRQACAGCPAAPTGLRVSNVGEEEITLAWGANPESNVIGYRLYRNGAEIQPEPISTTSHTDTGLSQGVTYAYYVTAINDAGQASHPSSSLSVQIPDPSGCRSQSATLAQHVAQNRAYVEEQCLGWWCWFWPWPKTASYYARGSDELIGTDGNETVVLYTRDGQNYSTQDCRR